MVTKGLNDGFKEIHGDTFDLLPRHEKIFRFIRISTEK